MFRECLNLLIIITWSRVNVNKTKKNEKVTFAGVVCQSPISSTFNGPEKQMVLKVVLRKLFSSYWRLVPVEILLLRDRNHGNMLFKEVNSFKSVLNNSQSSLKQHIILLILESSSVEVRNHSKKLFISAKRNLRCL